jgi:hypothetical protein
MDWIDLRLRDILVLPVIIWSRASKSGAVKGMKDHCMTAFALMLIYWRKNCLVVKFNTLQKRKYFFGGGGGCGSHRDECEQNYLLGCFEMQPDRSSQTTFPGTYWPLSSGQKRKPSPKQEAGSKLSQNQCEPLKFRWARALHGVTTHVTVFALHFIRGIRKCCRWYKKSYPCNRPWRTIGFWDVEALTFSRQSAHRWQ